MLALSVILLLSIQLPGTVVAQVTTLIQTAVRFEKQPFCPSPAQRSALKRLIGVTSASPCAVECAAQANCSAVHRAGLDCYLAARSDWQDAWSAAEVSCQGNTSTLVRLPSASANLTDRLVTWLSLRVSLGNLANTSAAPAALTGSAAQRNASGATLPGLGDSYVQVPSPDPAGLDSKRGAHGQFAMLAKAEWQPRPNATYLIRAASAEPAFTVVVWLYEESRRLKFGNRRAVSDNYQTGVVIPEVRYPNSVGVSFNGTNYTVYVNGKSEAVSIYSDLPATSAAGTDIRLGAKHGEALTGAMEGRFICFGYWARDVTAQEFAEFEKLC